MSLLLEISPEVETCCVSLWKSCVDGGNRELGEGQRDSEALTQSLAGVAIWDNERWQPDLVKSRLRTVKKSTGAHALLVSSPLILQSLSPIHLSEGDNMFNSSYSCDRHQVVPPCGSHWLLCFCLLWFDKLKVILKASYVLQGTPRDTLCCSQ